MREIRQFKTFYGATINDEEFCLKREHEMALECLSLIREFCQKQESDCTKCPLFMENSCQCLFRKTSIDVHDPWYWEF